MTIATTVLTALMAVSLQLTDTIIAVPADARLDMTAMGGSIAIDTWDRSEVRVQATHGSRDEVRVRSNGSVVTIRAERSRGFVSIVDYRITVPAAMDLSLNAPFARIEIDGTRGRVNANTVEGDIAVRGGDGQLTLRSVQGRVSVREAAGTIKATSVAGRVEVRNAVGPIEAESVSGSVVLESIDSRDVLASAVSGDVHYGGTIANDGRYGFASHSGDVTIAVPRNLNATITVALMSGRFASRIEAIPSEGYRRGARETFTVGTGAAMIEMESFSGDLRIIPEDELVESPI